MKSFGIVLVLAAGLSLAAASAPGATLHVAAGNAGAQAPYTNWATAAAVLQDAVSIAHDGDLVLVNDGVYDTGGRIVSGSLASRVAITNAIIVRSVNGPGRTVIAGHGPLTNSPVRCAYVASHATLAGFTLTNGCTLGTGDLTLDMSGGGALCEAGATVSNCVIAGNFAQYGGGGIYGGSIHRSHITGNRAETGRGGGASSCDLRNSVVARNSAHYGGGISDSTAIHSTIAANSAHDILLPHFGVQPGQGGGTIGCTVSGAIVCYNSASIDPNNAAVAADHTCTTPDPGGAGNITADPRFVAWNIFNLLPGSPCIDAATDPGTGVDIRGFPRPFDGNHDGLAAPDMGAYEFRPSPPADFDNDSLSDIACYHPDAGAWYAFTSRAGFWQTQFGFPGTWPFTGDFDGDGLTDFGCYYPPAGQWFFFTSAAGFSTTQFGFNGTMPVTADFDLDGRTDIGCYNPPTGEWFIFQSTAGFTTRQFGFAGTWPVTGDFDADGIADIGCYYPPAGQWYLFTSAAGFSTFQFGFDGTLPATGDYDGDGRTDIACYHPPTGQWYLFCTTTGFLTTQFGFIGTLPVH